jgi:hypothetical protein
MADASEDNEAFHTETDGAGEGIRRRERAGQCSGFPEACMRLAGGGRRPAAAADPRPSGEEYVQRAIAADDNLQDRWADAAGSDESRAGHSIQVDSGVQMNR